MYMHVIYLYTIRSGFICWHRDTHTARLVGKYVSGSKDMIKIITIDGDFKHSHQLTPEYKYYKMYIELIETTRFIYLPNL